MAIYLLSCFGIIWLLTFYIFYVIYQIQPNPYIDETFHVPQAQKYCSGAFREWDPKITTLPGLYLISLSIVKPLSIAFGEDFCDVCGLRAVNLLIFVLNSYVLLTIRKKLYWKKNARLSVLWQLLRGRQT